MTPFIQLPVSLQDHLLGVLAFIIYLQMAGIAAAYVWTRSRRQMLPFVLLFLFHLALLVLMTAGRGYFSLGEHRYPLAFRLIQCPLNVILLYLLAAALLDLFLLYRLWRLYQRSITKNSIKESADSMPRKPSATTRKSSSMRMPASFWSLRRTAGRRTIRMFWI